MNWWQQLKYFFKRGGKRLEMLAVGENLESIEKHPKINVDKQERERIKQNFNIYAGKYDRVNYINSNGKSVQRDFFYLNMMKEVSRYISSVVFNEQCKIVISKTIDDSNKNTLENADDFIQHVFTHNKFKKNFAKYLEVMFATGGLAVRPYADVETGEIEFSWCLADTFYPIKNNSNGISECVISGVTTIHRDKETLYYTLLEFHEWKDDVYVVSNELYVSQEKNKLGKRVPLFDLYEGLEEQVTIKNLTRPMFAYLKPFGFNNISPHSPLGLGVCDNAKRTLEQINQTFDAFHWEIKQGKRKVIVTDHFLKTRDENGYIKQYLDDETDVFVALGGGIDDMKYQELASDIRASSYIESINKFMATLEMQVGLSTGTFTFDGKSIKTATEVVSENSATYRTRNSHIVEVEEFIKELIISVFELAKATVLPNGQRLYAGEIPESDDIGIDFDDGVFTDKNAQLEFLSKATTTELMPKVEAIQRLFNIPEEEATKWLEQINNEKYTSNPQTQQEISSTLLFGEEE